jgi:hypothetical protein
MEPGTRVIIPAIALEFNVEGNTIWVHSPNGGTIFRLKCTGKIHVDKCTNSPISHTDVMVTGDINFCLAEDAES